VGLVAAGVVVAAGRLGLGGTALAATPWTGWAVNAVVAVILPKVVFVAVHVVLGRRAIRRGRSFQRRWTWRHSARTSMSPTRQTADAAPGEEYT
jgi:hypothetical protein